MSADPKATGHPKNAGRDRLDAVRRGAVRALVAVVAFAAPLVGLSAARAAEAAAKAEPVKVTITTVADTKEVLATVESVRSPQARARIGGTVDTLVVAEGDAVKKGDVLATVTDPKLSIQLVAADARIAALEAKLAQQETDLERATRLRATGAAPQSRLDDAETLMTVTKAEIAAARADRAVIAEQVTEGRILAPDDGRILKVTAVAGQVIMPGEPIATLATADYILKLRLPERHARFLHDGDTVLVAGRGLDIGREGGLGQGKIVRVYPELDQGRVVADARAAGIGDYFVGERIRVLVATGTRDTIVLPEDVLVRREGLTFVTLAGGDEIPVQTGRRLAAEAGTPPRVEILTGLVAGDAVLRPEGARP